MTGRQLALAGLEPAQPARDWVIRVTHPAHVAGDYGPFERAAALELAAAYKYPQSVFPHRLIPGAVLVGHLTGLMGSSNETDQGEGAA